MKTKIKRNGQNINELGITLIALAITVVVLIILASITIYSGVETIKSSRVKKFETEMKVLQTQINKIRSENKEFKETDGEVIQNGSTHYNELLERINLVTEYGYSNKEEDIANYRFFTAQELKDDLSIEGVEQSVFINLDKRKVISLDGVKYEEKIVYVLEQLPNNLYNVDYIPLTEESNVILKINADIVNEYKGEIQGEAYFSLEGKDNNDNTIWSNVEKVKITRPGETTNNISVDLPSEVTTLKVTPVHAVSGTISGGTQEVSIQSEKPEVSYTFEANENITISNSVTLEYNK